MSKKPVFRAGVIPYIIEDNQIKMMFMRPSDPHFGTDTFQISKGHIEDGESNQIAALREGREELGLFEGNIEQIYDLGTFMGRTSLYVAKIKDKDMFGDPCNETVETRWMSPEEFYEVGRDLHNPVVKAAVRLIEMEEGVNERYDVLESYSTRQDLSWVSSISKQGGTQEDASFSLQDEDYNITLLHQELKLPTQTLHVVEVSFQRIVGGTPEIKLTKSNYVSQVMGIIYNAVIEKLFVERPDIILLSAKNMNDESNVKILQRRLSLYSAIAHKILQHGIYTVLPDHIRSAHATNIVLLRNDKNAVTITPDELQFVKDNI